MLPRKAIFSLLILLVASILVLNGCSESSKHAQRRQLQNQATELSNETPSVRNNTNVNPVSDNENDLTLLYAKLSPSVLTIITEDDDSMYQGSGFILSSDGICVSNYHVFEGTTKGLEKIYVNGRTYKIERVLDYDDDLDYIIFKLANATNLPYLKISNKDVKVGMKVFAIGNPRGLDKTLSEGIVSQLRPERGLIQITAAITHGSSGGPLFNSNGDLIGITTSGFGEANLNFAVDIKELPMSRFLK